MRTLMIQAAHGLLRSKKENDLKAWANQLFERMGNSKPAKRKVVVARKLSVLLHRLWITGERYQPFHKAHKKPVLQPIIALGSA